MRILILHSRYRSGPASGENRVVDDEARLLSEAGHQVDVFAPEVGQPSTLQMIKAGLGAIWSREAVAEVRRRVERRKPDIVHCHNLFPALSPAVLRATDEVPLLVTLHNYRFLCLPATFLRDGEVCEDCLGRLPVAGGGSRLLSGVRLSQCGPRVVIAPAQGDRHVRPHQPLPRDQRLRAAEAHRRWTLEQEDPRQAAFRLGG